MAAWAVLRPSKPRTGRMSCLERAVVGLDDVVEVLDLPVLSALRAPALGLQLGQRRGVGRRAVDVDHPRRLPGLQAPQRLAREALGRLGVARRREGEGDGGAVRVDGAAETGPFAPHLHVGLAARARTFGSSTRRLPDRGRRHCQRRRRSIPGACFCTHRKTVE